MRIPGRSLVVFLFLLLPFSLGAAPVEYIDATPLQDVVKTKASPVRTSGKLRLPLITWGGDVATIHAVEWKRNVLPGVLEYDVYVAERRSGLDPDIHREDVLSPPQID